MSGTDPIAGRSNPYAPPRADVGEPGSSSGVPSQLARAWSRYWARNLDLFLWSCLLFFLLGMFAPGLFEPGGLLAGLNDYFVFLLVLPFAMFVDTVAYAAFGNTPGKWICGIRILDLSGEKVPFLRNLLRNLKVYVFGLGAGIPIVTLFTCIGSHSRLTAGELLSWDDQSCTRVFQVKPGAWRTYIAAIAYVALVLALFALGAMTESGGP
jgi:uncharacterized RDD family membrane protein YckC